MEARTLVLLHSPGSSAREWAALPSRLREHASLTVVTVDIPATPRGPDAAGTDGPAAGTRYVAAAAAAIWASVGAAAVVLVGRGGAGPLLPRIGFARRARHAAVGGYVFFDAALPGAAGSPAFPIEWPDAPCGYLRTLDAYRPQARQAQLRGWPVVEPAEVRTAAHGDAAAAASDGLALAVLSVLDQL